MNRIFMVTMLATMSFSMPAYAQNNGNNGNTPPPFSNPTGGDSFSMSGDGMGSGGTFSQSNTNGFSSTSLMGNGAAEQSSFSGATQSDLSSFGTSFEEGTIELESSTLSQGETLSASSGFERGSAVGETSGFAERSGNSWSGGSFDTEFEFGSGASSGSFNPPGNPFNN